MSKNLRECIEQLNLLCKTKSKKVKLSLLNELSQNDKVFYAIYEILYNFSLNKIKLRHAQKKKLKKSIKTMERILAKPKSKAIRASLVVQSGGFLPTLLPIVIPIIAELISNAISKKNNSDSS